MQRLIIRNKVVVRNGKKMLGVLCDQKINLKLRGKVYRNLVKLAMLFIAETWMSKKTYKTELNVTEMNMLG